MNFVIIFALFLMVMFVSYALCSTKNSPITSTDNLYKFPTDGSSFRIILAFVIIFIALLVSYSAYSSKYYTTKTPNCSNNKFEYHHELNKKNNLDNSNIKLQANTQDKLIETLENTIVDKNKIIAELENKIANINVATENNLNNKVPEENKQDEKNNL